ncbi:MULTISPECIES: MAB_1171c family putative transporter [unclassified Mycobacterium]|uniref:MAB_1171c family putative transporter n=1 Tax=unclassified Mycobacterium TaxID=2642494 RepID=UPI0009919546|nr:MULTISPECIES: MAB_1171c family putative transporter [unclassified Mycobacterium]
MTSAVPGLISWPVFACFVLVLAFRRRWLNTGLAARHRNRALTYLAATHLASEPQIQHLLAATIPSTTGTTSQIPLALLLLTCPEVIGIIAMTDGIDPAALVRGYRHYRIATVVTLIVLYFVAISPRRQDQPIALAGDNSEVLAAAIWSVLSVTATAVILWQLAKNLRQTRTTTAQRLIAVELGAIAALICLPGLSIFTLALLERLDLAHTLPVRQAIYSYASFGALLAALPLALGPCFVAAQSLLHRDANGRTWKKLQPLWTDLTTAYPDTVLNASPQRFQPVTDFQLHRVIIEIRDALLQLAPHITELADTDRQRLAQACGQSTVDQGALQALQIANAIAHPTSTDPSPTSSAPLATTATRDDELTQLIDIAAWWPTVTHIAQEQSRVRSYS